MNVFPLFCRNGGFFVVAKKERKVLVCFVVCVCLFVELLFFVCVIWNQPSAVTEGETLHIMLPDT